MTRRAATPERLNAKERRQLRALRRKWAMQKADGAQIARCRELERRERMFG